MSAKAAELWKAAQERVRERVTNQEFEAWIQPVRVASGNARSITLKVPSKFFQDYFAERYLKDIGDIASEISGGDVHIDFAIDGGTAPPLNKARSLRRRSIISSEVQLNPKYTFDTYVIGPSNHFAHAACTAVANSPGKAYNPLFIYGGVGLGKTHLMQAIGHHILQRSDMRVYYISSEKFVNQLINSIQNRTMVKFRNKYRNVDVLLIDDIHFLGGKEQTQEEFFHTFNALYDAHKQIVLSSDRTPKDIPRLEERLVSRFEWGLVTDLQAPDTETRIAILKKKAEADNVHIPDDVIFFIADKIKSNVRKLEGALNRVIAYSSLKEIPITMPMVEDILQEIISGEESQAISIDCIQRRVAEYYDIRVADMTSKRRPQAIAFPRQVAMYLSRKLTRKSLPELGDAFGGRDHTTILYAYKQVDSKIHTDPSLRRAISLIERRIRS